MEYPRLTFRGSLGFHNRESATAPVSGRPVSGGDELQPRIIGSRELIKYRLPSSQLDGPSPLMEWDLVALVKSSAIPDIIKRVRITCILLLLINFFCILVLFCLSLNIINTVGTNELTFLKYK